MNKKSIKKSISYLDQEIWRQLNAHIFDPLHEQITKLIDPTLDDIIISPKAKECHIIGNTAELISAELKHQIKKDNKSSKTS